MTTIRKKEACLVTMAVNGTSLAACEGGQRQTLGTLGGAVAGGLAGSQIVDDRGRLIAIGPGVLIGAVAVGEIGKSLDRADKLYLQQTTHSALESAPSGQVRQWENPDSGNSGTIRAEAAFQNSSEEFCREFRQTATIVNETHDACVTACRQPDGSWEIVR